MAFDFKKEYKELYLPPKTPQLVSVPPINYIAVRGIGDPNEENGAYKAAIGLLYGVAYTIKMSKRSDRRIEGFFDYVVPPLEGFWRQEGVDGFDYTRKDLLHWISVIRLPDFVTRADLDWAVAEASKKKKQDFSKVEFLNVDEGLCVQAMHNGPYDDEPATIAAMDEFVRENGYANDFSDARQHHEIYLSDVNKVEPARLKTVIRHPVRRLGGGKMTIAELKAEEIDAALKLVWDVFLQYEAPEYSAQGVEEFRKSIGDPKFLARLRTYGAFRDERLVGVIATRSGGSHIALFFVDGAYQRQGIGRALFERACEDNSAHTITVNSSPYAVPVYHRLGFADTDTEQVTNGLRYTPMVLNTKRH